MKLDEFRAYLHGRDTTPEKIEDYIALAMRFECFLEVIGVSSPTVLDVQAFAGELIREGRNTWDNFVALARYEQFTGSDEIYLAVVELVDGVEVLDNLYDRLGELAGEPLREQVFAGIQLPPMGTPVAEKPPITQAVMQRLETLVDDGTRRALFSSSFRDLPDENYLEDKEKYQACAGLDEYLERRRVDYIAYLESLKEEGKLYYTQEVTEGMIQFVRDHPEISSGIRDGNTVIETKIPYMTQQYLDASDERMKRYYYCHCPWVRESIRSGDVQVSPAFCQCSAGYTKRPWEVIFGQPVEAEVLETVLQGDRWCRFAIHLPLE